MSTIIIYLIDYNRQRRNLQVASRYSAAHSVPGNALDCFSFIVYSRFVNRPVTRVAIQHNYRPFFLLLV